MSLGSSIGKFLRQLEERVVQSPVRSLCLLTILLLPSLSFATTGKEAPLVRFDHYTIREGLSQSTVNCILQDRKGFIWIGTQDGLNRFDAYSFESFRKDPQNSRSLSNNFIRAIEEGGEGTLWIGTEGGLERLDRNEEEFHKVPILDGERVTVNSLLRDEKGRVWVGTAEKGLFVLASDSSSARRPSIKTAKRSEQNAVQSIRSLHADKKGGLWIGTGEDGLFHYQPRNGKLQNTRVPNTGVHCVHLLSKDHIWVGTEEGAFELERGDEGYELLSHLEGNGEDEKLPHPVVEAIHEDRSGRLWFGTAGGGLALMEEDEGERHFHHYQYRDYDPSSLSNDLVHAIREDRSGTVWVGSNRGLSKFDPYKQNFRHITSWVLSDRGLNDKNVWTIEEERGGILWVGTRKGITRIDRNEEKYQHFDQNIQDRPGVNDQSVLSLHVEDGKVWAGTVDGLYRLREAEGPSRAHYERVDYIGNGGRDIERSRLYCIYPRPDGKLWLGSRNGLKLFDPETGHTRLFNEDSSSHPRLSGSVIRDIHQDKEGVYWIATDDGGLNRLRELPEKDSLAFELEHFKNDPEDPHSLSTNTLMSIWEGERGHLWIGTYGGGMNRFDPESGHVKRFTEKDGLANNVVYGVLGDGEGKLWMSTNQGLSRFDISEERFRNFDESDGLQSDEFNIGAYHRSSDGELFFGGINGLNAFYPSNITRNPHPPQVVFTGLRLFNLQDEAEKEKDPWERIRGKDRIVLEHDQNNFTIEFAALHFSRPGKNRYRYILKGFDKDPVEAGTDRTAHYTNLDPGSYSFEVHASNDDGVWTEEPARIEILVKTPFWMSWWFRGTLALSVLLIGFGAYRYRVALVEEQKRKLEREVRRRTQEVTQQKERIEEQNKELEEEKNKVDKLLVNLLPEDTANELKTGGKASARHYRMASVMFTDFKAFTKIAEKVKPTELVAKLDSYFINFDKIIERWELEKIKTIGDSYMAAGGIPIRNKTNPIHTVLAGLEIQRYMREQKERLKGKEEEAWELRIGVHTGELIAGVIGIKRFAYDIWGDTVNVASRMESNGEVGKVNISGATYSYVEPFFETSYRGKVHAKNKGHIDMYFVEGIKPELSVDGKGEEPAKPFWDFVNLHFFSKINYRKAEKSLLKKLRKELPSDLYYHDVRHTVDVCQAVERLAFMEGVEGEDLFLLKTAALFHDAGFVEQYANNEWIGARMAKEMLPKYGYTEEQLDQVASMIHATQVPPKPSNHLEEIICDADLDYLGRDDFHEIADRLKQELMERGYIQGQVEWDRMQVAFLKEHRYFTDSAIKLRRKKKEQHLREVEERLSQLEEGKDRKGEGRDPQRKG